MSSYETHVENMFVANQWKDVLIIYKSVETCIDFRTKQQTPTLSSTHLTVKNAFLKACFYS